MKSSSRITLLLAVAAVCGQVQQSGGGRASIAPAQAAPPKATAPLFGFTTFPYDYTLEAVEKTQATIVPNSTLYALHFDDGIPWKELLGDAPFPARVQREWDDRARAVPKDHVVYVALAPLATDRKSLAPAIGEQGRTTMPPEIANAPLDDPQVERAYLRYAERAVIQFHPRYLNIGIEAGEILSRDYARWPHFVALYRYVYQRLKAQRPTLQIGISFGLGELRAAREAQAARDLLPYCDYVGLSFYPYASGFDEKFGAPPYAGPHPWREPLAWIRAYTNKPLAICETGFTTQDVDIPAYGLHLHGTTEMQAEYVKELFDTARRDRYLFVVWFLAIDYDKLYAKMPPGSEAMKLWRNIGLLDGRATAKPAWAVWQRELRR